MVRGGFGGTGGFGLWGTTGAWGTGGNGAWSGRSPSAVPARAAGLGFSDAVSTLAGSEGPCTGTCAVLAAVNLGQFAAAAETGVMLATSIMFPELLFVGGGGIAGGSVATSGVIYGPKVLGQMANAADKFHGFPTLLDDMIVANGAVKLGNRGYVEYGLKGLIDLKSKGGVIYYGQYQIGMVQVTKGYWEIHTASSVRSNGGNVMLLKLEESFPRQYGVEVGVDWDPSGNRGHVFGGGGGLVVKLVPPVGKAWWGAFPADELGVTGLFTTPDPGTILIVGGGAGFWIRSEAPEEARQVERFPILHVLSSRSPHLLLLGDFVSISAYDSNGLRWTSPKLGSDEIRALQVDRDRVRGEGWRADLERWVPFELDLRDGSLLAALPSPTSPTPPSP